MSAGNFFRLLKRTFNSSLMLEDPATRWLFLRMLDLADDGRRSDGVVDMPVEVLAAMAFLTVEQTVAALARLSSPDPKSRSQKDEGRRIRPLDRADGMAPRGWRIVNWDECKAAAEADRKAYNQRKYRATLPTVARPLPLQTQTQTQTQTQKKREGEASSDAHTPPPSAKKKPEPRKLFEPPTVAEVEDYIEEQIRAGRRHYRKVNPARFVAYYDSVGWKRGKAPMKNWRAAVFTWASKEGE